MYASWNLCWHQWQQGGSPLRLRSHRHAVPARTYRRQVANRHRTRTAMLKFIWSLHLLPFTVDLLCQRRRRYERRLVERTCACAWLSPCQTTRRVQFHGELCNWHFWHLMRGNDVGIRWNLLMKATPRVRGISKIVEAHHDDKLKFEILVWNSAT